MSKGDEYIQKLLNEARSGDGASMGNLAVIVRDRLHPFIMRTTLNYDLTEDILQETLLCMLHRIHSLRDCSRFWPWIFRIAWNKFQDCLRQQELQVSAKDTLVRNSRHIQQNNGDGPLESEIRTEAFGRLAEVLEQLSRQQKDIIRLRYYEQLSFSKIAAATSTSPASARSQFHRAKQALKKRLL